MKTISIFSFHFGDIIGGGSGVNDWIKLGVPILFSVGIVLYQRSRDKKKDQRKNILKLFNLNQHIKHIIKLHARVQEVFGSYSKQVLENPFDENLLIEKMIIPDFIRMLDINKDDVFSAFNTIYSDKEEAATDYRIIYNCIEYYKQIFELLDDKYMIISNDLFEERKNIREYFFRASFKHAQVIAQMENEIKGYQQFPPYIELVTISQNFNAKEKEFKKSNEGKTEVEKKSIPLQFLYDNLIDRLSDALPKYKNIPILLDFFADVVKLTGFRSDSIHSSIELANQLQHHLNILPQLIEKLQEKSDLLDVKLKPYVKMKEKSTSTQQPDVTN